jgi:hypothetical protein
MKLSSPKAPQAILSAKLPATSDLSSSFGTQLWPLCRGTVLGSFDYALREGAKFGVPNMAQAQTFYEGHSYEGLIWSFEGLIWSFVREWIGHCLRARYQVPKELPPQLLTLVRKLGALESRSPRARGLIGVLDTIEGNHLMRYAPPVEPRSVDLSDELPLCT